MYVVKLTTMGNPIITGQLLHWKKWLWDIRMWIIAYVSMCG